LLKIRLKNRFINENRSICKLSVDATDFRIPEQKPFWTGWYSHKFKGPGLRYEVALSIQNGWICWIKGPFAPGPWPDVKIFRGWLKHRLQAGERCEADLGYQGEFAINDPREFNTAAERKMKENIRARHETVNRRFKQFNCLKNFRHSIDLHGYCFDAIAVITQLGIENGEPLFQVHYEI
jgi:hypothetical protein